LFLDEIANLPLQLQGKLLSVLENRMITRVGSNTASAIDVRLICATNMPIYNLVKQGKFRQDLLYRINTVEIQLPPLRERLEDIPLLVSHFLTVYSKKYKKSIKSVNTRTLKKLKQYHWPGNVRELQHAIERAVIMSEHAELQPSDFLFPSSEVQEEKSSFEKYTIEDAEKMAIRKALKKHNGNISRAAKELGLTRTSLYRRLEKYGL
jgi:transcriptional regulator with PAS, ATPase and Fis domain